MRFAQRLPLVALAVWLAGCSSIDRALYSNEPRVRAAFEATGAMSKLDPTANDIAAGKVLYESAFARPQPLRSPHGAGASGANNAFARQRREFLRLRKAQLDAALPALREGITQGDYDHIRADVWFVKNGGTSGYSEVGHPLADLLLARQALERERFREASRAAEARRQAIARARASQPMIQFGPDTAERIALVKKGLLAMKAAEDAARERRRQELMDRGLCPDCAGDGIRGERTVKRCPEVCNFGLVRGNWPCPQRCTGGQVVENTERPCHECDRTGKFPPPA
ncbi:MAG: hypothetical protein AAF561_01290 [Planctomycetota bacterium]